MKKVVFISLLLGSIFQTAMGQNVGIGTTTPSTKLEVIGTAKADTLQGANFKMTVGALAGYVLQSDGDGNASWVSPSASVVLAGSGLSYAGNTLNSVWTEVSGNIYNNNGGHTGVGTTTPVSKLEVSAADITSLTVTSTNTEATDLAIKNSTIGSSIFRWTGPAHAAGQQKLLFVSPGSDVTMTVDHVQNNVGIGTTSPVTKLDVNGVTRTSGFQLTNGFADGYILKSDPSGNGNWVAVSSAVEAGTGLSYSGSTLNSVWTASGSNIYNNNTANVGIGTSSPTARLHVFNGGGNSAVTVQSESNNAYVNLNAGVSGMESSIATFTNGVQRWSFGKSNSTESGSNTGSDFFINRYNDAGTFQNQPVVIKRTNGHVGINQGNPVQQLDVNGNINVSASGAYYFGNARMMAMINIDNTVVGVLAAPSLSSGIENTLMGYGALSSLTSGNRNVALGYGSGFLNNGLNNTFIGHSAGSGNTGNGSVFIGYQAGSLETDGNKLYIDNSSTTSPLLYGDFSKDSAALNGSFTIEGAMGLKVRTGLAAGTTNPNATAGIWIYSSGTGTIDLSVAAGTDRVLIILNNTGAARTISSYRDLSNTAQTAIANNTSLWLVYDGSNWRQIK